VPPAAAPELRQDDTGAGRVAVTATGEPLTAQDHERLAAAERQRAEDERQRVEEMLASEESLFLVPQFLRSPLAYCALLALGALLGLFVLAQVTSTLASLASLPAWARYPGWVGLALLAGALLYVAGRFALFYWRLRPNQPVKVRSLAQLAERTRLRWLVQEKQDEARTRLRDYLQAYPLTPPEVRRALVEAGLTEEQLQELGRVREELLDPNRFAGTDQWFAEFGSRFQAPLDRAAEARIVHFARRVAVMTAVSPNTLMDTLLTSYCSFALLGDLCLLYNLRVNRAGTAVLLSRLFFNAYVAGQLNQLESLTEAGIQNLVDESGLDLGSLALEAVAGKVVGKVGARAASGLLNYFLLKRLGAHAVRLLRPVRSE
jgi:uncharacterized membrane protein YcjF (UPF0283 family)